MTNKNNQIALASFLVPTILYAISWYMYKYKSSATASEKEIPDYLYYAAIATQIASILFIVLRLRQ